MIARQYVIASPVVLPERAWPCLTKKLTVIGTIGQTHGMTRAPRPPAAHQSRKGMSPRSVSRPESSPAAAVAASLLAFISAIAAL